jgi:hypothetical protein
MVVETNLSGTCANCGKSYWVADVPVPEIGETPTNRIHRCVDCGMIISIDLDCEGYATATIFESSDEDE